MPLQKNDFDYSESADYVVTESYVFIFIIPIRETIDDSPFYYFYPVQCRTQKIHLQKDVSMRLTHPRSDLITFAIYQRNYPKDSVSGHGHCAISPTIGIVLNAVLATVRYVFH